VLFSEENTPIVSSYNADFAMGGDKNDFVAVYGGYKGSAFQFYGGQQKDISFIFDYKAMAGGFSPVVIYNKANNAWYVFSKDVNNLRFFKLFEDGNGWIIGGVDLTDNFKNVSQIVADQNGQIYVDRNVDGKTSWYQFVDNGFDCKNGGEVVSSNINSSPNQSNYEVRDATIESVKMSTSTSNVEFYFSNGNNLWQKASLGEKIIFQNINGKELYWKVKFSGINNCLTSPFFNFINIGYSLNEKK
jgi:hypothetical protein